MHNHDRRECGSVMSSGPAGGQPGRPGPGEASGTSKVPLSGSRAPAGSTFCYQPSNSLRFFLRAPQFPHPQMWGDHQACVIEFREEKTYSNSQVSVQLWQGLICLSFCETFSENLLWAGSGLGYWKQSIIIILKKTKPTSLSFWNGHSNGQK